MARDADFQRTSLRLSVQVGDLVRAESWPRSSVYDVGIITCVDPEEIGDAGEVEVLWLDDNRVLNHTTRYLEVISASR